MIPRVPTAGGPPPSADPAFDLLVDELIARLQAGEAPDWPAVTLGGGRPAPALPA